MAEAEVKTLTPEEVAAQEKQVEKTFSTAAKSLGVELVDAEEVSARVDEVTEVIGGKNAQMNDLFAQAKVLNGECDALRADLRTWDAKLGKVKLLVKTCRDLGLAIPAKYASLVPNAARSASNGTSTGNGKLFRFDGFDCSDARLGGCTISRGIVLTTKGSGGTGLEGRLHRNEADAFLQSEGLQFPTEVGASITVTWRNGKTGTITRVS